jgi:hypothetical protein
MAQSISDMSAVWGTATQFTGIKYNVTGTDSSLSTSNLIDLQVGGDRRFAVNKSGAVTVKNDTLWNRTNANSLFYIGATSFYVYGTSTTVVGSDNNAWRLTDYYSLSWTNGTAGGTVDLSLFRDAANTLAQRNGANGQTFRIYNTFTDASNHERGKIEWSSNVLRIGTEKAGSGTARALELQTDGTTRLTIAATGAISTPSPLEVTANAPFDVVSDSFAINAENPRLSFLMSTITARFSALIGSNKYAFRGSRASASGGVNFVGVTDGDATALLFQGWVGATSVANSPIIFRAYKSNGTNDVANLGATEPVMAFRNGTATILQLRGDGLVQFAGTDNTFPALKRSSTTLQVRLADDSANAPIESASVKTDAPAGGTSGTWKLGVAATVSPTSPNRTIEVDIGGTIYYIAAKTTND